MDAVILVGGLGTRLKEVGLNVPKPLAPISGRPFLDILLRKLESMPEITRVILAAGHKKELIKEYCERAHFRFPILFSDEEVPLGTGGAVLKALQLALSEDVLVLNGDTYLDFNLASLFEYHREKKGVATLVCLPSPEEERYGVIQRDDEGKITHFQEKGGKKGWISAGVYLMKKDSLFSFPEEKPFSLEQEGFPSLLKKGLFSYPCTSFFIDIGTKHSYFEAQECLKNRS